MARCVVSIARWARPATMLASLAVGFVLTSGCREYTCLDTVSCNQATSSASQASDDSNTNSSSGPTPAPLPNAPTQVTNSTTGAPTVSSPPTTLSPPSSPTASSHTDNPAASGPSSPGETIGATGTESGLSLSLDTDFGLTSAPDSDQPGVTEVETVAVSSDRTWGDDSTQEPNPTTASDEVPATSHCAPVADWDPAWSEWEAEVLQLVNEVRAAGADCDSEGSFGPTTPLAMDPMLRCSSRLHSEDMYVRDYFDHTNPDGLDPFERMDEAGFNGGWMGENIAYGQQSPEEVMQAWVDSDGHCSNIMNPNFTLIGVGYYPGGANWQEGQHFWTQNFGTPLN